MIQILYCPQCKAKLISKGLHFWCSGCNETLFQNSKPGAGVLIVRGDEVLLSVRAFEPMKGAFDIIGGFLEPGEHPNDGAKREVKEETGLDVKLVELLGIYMDYNYDSHTLNCIFIGEITGGVMQANDDVSDLVWFKITSLPHLNAFNHVNKAIIDLKQWHKIIDAKMNKV